MTRQGWPGLSAVMTGSGRRVGWGLAGQALSSLTNFFVGIIVARSVGLDEFGAYALAFSAYCLVLGVSRALTTEPFAVRFSAGKDAGARHALASASGTALLIGFGAGVVAVGAAFMFLPQHRELVLVLAVVLPGIILQDAWRMLFFAVGRGRDAFLNDLVWAVLLVPAFWIDFLDGEVSAASLTLAWGCAGTAAGIYGAVQFRGLPGFAAAGKWLRDNKRLWPRYLCEGLAVNGSQQIYMLALAGLTSLAAVGALKLVLVVLGPVNVLAQGIGAVAVPEAARARLQSRSRLTATAAAFSVVIAGGALAWGTAMMLMPAGWIAAAAGNGWPAAAALLVPVVLSQVFNGANTGPVAGLRAMAEAKRSMWTRICSSTLVVLAVLGGAVAAGISGAAWGLAAAAAVNTVHWMVQYRLAGRTNPEPAQQTTERMDARRVATSAPIRGRGKTHV